MTHLSRIGYQRHNCLHCDYFYVGGHRLVSVGFSVVSYARAVMKNKEKAMRYLCILMHYPFIILCVLKETLNDRPREWGNISGPSYCDALGDTIVIIVIISIITIIIISHGIQSIQACSLFMCFDPSIFSWSSYISSTIWSLFIQYLRKARIVHS